MRVHAIGYVGMGNLGDELFADVALSGMLWPGADVRLFAPRQPGAWSSDSLLGRGLRASATVAGAAWADTFALVGGSVLQDLNGTTRLRDALAAGRRQEAIGVSIGPFRDDAARRRVLAHLDRCERVIVRDPASAARAGRDLVMGGDLAALHPLLQAPGPGGETLVVCPSAPARTQPDALAAALAATGERPPVIVLGLDSHPRLGDGDECRRVAAALAPHAGSVVVETSAQLGIAGTLARIGGARAVWSERLHGAIVAHLLGIGFALRTHHAKCTDLADTIGLADERRVTDDWRDAAVSTLAGGSGTTMSPDAARALAWRTYAGRDACPST